MGWTSNVSTGYKDKVRVYSIQGTVNAYFSASHSIFDFIATEGMLSTLMV